MKRTRRRSTLPPMLPDRATYRGTFWCPSTGALQMPAEPTPAGYSTEARLETMLQAPTRRMPDRMLVIWEFMHSENWRDYRIRITRERHERRPSAKAHTPRPRTTKGNPKP